MRPHNADSHLRALLLGHSLTLQISGGEVVLGQWQRLLMAELDGPRTPRLTYPGSGDQETSQGTTTLEGLVRQMRAACRLSGLVDIADKVMRANG